MNRLDPDERHQVHNARILELQSGEISGKEFVSSLVSQVGFSTLEARGQWQELKDQGSIAIYDLAKSRCMVQYPFIMQEGCGRIMPVIEWRKGLITLLYGSDLGAIVQTDPFDQFSVRFPFALFELRLCK